MTTQPQTVTIAQARLSAASGLLVLDTAANIANALPNPSLVSRVASFTVSAPGLLTFPQMSQLVTLGSKLHAPANALQLTGACTLTVAQLTALEALPGFAVSPTGNINLTDTTAQIVGMLAAHAAWFAQLSTITIKLDGSSIGAYPATQINGLITHGKTVVFVPTQGHTTLNIAAAAHDLATNAASLDALETHQALTFAVTNDGSAISATDAASLLTLQGFSPAAHTLTIADTGANLSPRLGGLLGRGFGQVMVTSGTLAGTPAQLLDASVHYAAGSHAQLAGSAIVSTSVATSLASLPGFTSAAGSVLTVNDTAANLLASSPAWIGIAGAASLSSDATISAQNAVGLAQISTALNGNLSLAGHSLTVADNLNALIALTGRALSLAAGVQLTSDATVNVSQFQSFRALPNVSAAGHAITISDAANNLLSLTGGLALVHATSLSADANVTASQLASLTNLPAFSSAGHAITVSDTAANLLNLAPVALSQVTATSLAADATCTAQQAQTLFADPGFTTGGHQLVVSDTATNLIGLPRGIQVAATLLSLAGSQTVTASTLSRLVGFGIKFTENGHTLVCQDTAANLAALTPPALALASAEVLATSATVNAATASLLAALPSFSLAQGASLTIQDSVGNLIALGQAAPAASTLELLPTGSVVTISASQAMALAALPHFSTAGAQITIAGSVADLTAAGAGVLQSVGTSIDVVDTAANLAAAANSALVQSATQVTLSGNAQVSAATAAQLAAIPHFSAGSYQLSVSDTAAHIAGLATVPLPSTTQYLITDSGPISTQIADVLATMSASGTLSFLGGDQLLVQDSYAALMNGANAPGIALAARIRVVDTASNLVAAASHDWGALNPSYTLAQPSSISGAIATSLAALGSHFSSGGFAIVVADTAAGVLAASSALTALSASATVTDTAADIGSHAGALANLGQSLTSIHVTDTNPISAATGASLSGLAALLTGPALQVIDTAADVNANLTSLATLHGHLYVSVVDSAADVAAYAPALSALGNQLTISLTDSSAVPASVAAGLLPVQGQLAEGSVIQVADTGTDVAAYVNTLASMLPVLGQISLTDGTTQSVAIAAQLSAVDGQLVPGIMLTAVGSVSDVVSNQLGLARLNLDGRLQVVRVANATVGDAVAQMSVLNSLPTEVTVADSAANVDAYLGALGQVHGLRGIVLTGGGTPALSMTLNTLAGDSSVLAKITTPYTITLSDTAAQIAADVASGNPSIIVSHLAQIGAIIASDGQPLVLDQTSLLTPGIDDGPGSLLTKFAGHLTATDVDVAHLTTVAGLIHAPDAIEVADSSTNIAADLAGGNASTILGALPSLTDIMTTDGSPVTLDAAMALSAHVDDGAQSAIALLRDVPLNVVGATVANLPSLLSLWVAPTGIAVADTAASISADLASPQSSLVADLSHVTSITVSDGLSIDLTEAQLLAPQIDDGAGSVFSKIAGGGLMVTGVAASDISELLDLPVAPTSLSLTDTGAHLVSNLANELASLGRISGITVTGAPLTLSADEALSAHVDDGSGSLIDLVTGHAFNVSGASVAQLTTLSSLPDTPTMISVTDTANNIVSDITSPSSALLSNTNLLGTLTVTHGVLTLTDAQAMMVIGTPALAAILGQLAPATQVVVTGVPVADLPTIASSGLPHLSVTVADGATQITADLASQNSVLRNSQSMISGVSLTAGGIVDAGSLANMASLPAFQTAGMPLVLQDSAAPILALSPTTLDLAQSIVIDDSSQQVAANLDALATLPRPLSITLTNTSPTLSVDATQYQADRVAIDAITNQGVVAVTGNASDLAAIAAVLANDADVSTVAVSDTAANVVGSLDRLSTAGAKLHVSLSDTSITANLVMPLLSIPTLNLNGLPVIDTGMQIAAVVEQGDAATLAYLNTYGAFLSDNSPVSAADAAALESLSAFNANGHTLVVWDTVQHLTSPAYTATLNNGLIGAICLRASSGSVSVTAAMAASLFALPNFSTLTPAGIANQLYVSDTAAHIDSALSTLTANRAAITNVIVNTTAAISDQMLADLQSLQATTAPGVNLTVRDTAAVIAANAATQSSGHTLAPVAWILSGNANVSEATAANLGSIAGFSTGGFTLTLMLTGDTSISVNDANEIGHLAGSLNLNGYRLIVAGSAAQLSGLSSAALQLVTPDLVDSAANIAALPADSPLLHGGVEVTGNDPLSAQTVTGLLNLVGSSGEGISPASLSIDNTHDVTDTVANIRVLVGSLGWTSNVSEQPHFRLIAQDSVAALVNPANTALLDTVTSSTLPADATMSAATAAALASLSSSIHFARGGHQITVDDTASNLLNPMNAAALTFANNILLAGPDHVDAADAETLLSTPNFALTVPLTIVDSSANLLDGQLASVIQNSGAVSLIHVELAGSETLDAQTATQLVALPGFADSSHLTIADDPSYLLDNASLPAEQMAGVVTLAGDETVSTNTVLRLSQLPHFTPGNSSLILASNDFANSAALKAVADMGTAFSADGHSITMTSDSLDLTPTEFTSLRADDVLQNGHQLGFIPTPVSISDENNVLSIAGAGVAGSTVRLYASNGAILSTTTQAPSGFTVTTPDIGAGQNFSLTEAFPNAGGEGAPLIVLDAAALEAEVAAAGASFATSGAIHLDSGRAINLYTTGTMPNLHQPALIYDPGAHTLSLDIPGQSPVTLLTLGTTTHPGSLDAGEIVFKTHG